MTRNMRIAAGLIALGAAGGLVISTMNYFSNSSGINGTGGALLVITSSAAVMLAALVLALRPGMRGWLRGTLLVPLLLGILGTGLAAYFLASTWLQVAMAICLIGWIVAILSRRAPTVHSASMVQGKASS